MSKNSKKINPKKIVIDYIDSLVNCVDIHTEEQLEKANSNDTIEIPSATAEDSESINNDFKSLALNRDEEEIDPFDLSKDPSKNLKGYTRFNSSLADFLPSGSIPMSDYLNMVRDEMIKNLRAIEVEALKQLASVKDELKFDDLNEDYEAKVDRVMAKAFAKRFPIIIEFVKQISSDSRIPPLNMFLLELDFFIGKDYSPSLL